MNSVDCPLTDEDLSLLLEGALPLDAARETANHILSCDRCARHLGHLAATETVLNLPAESGPYPELSDDFWPQLRERLDDVDRLVEATTVEEKPSRTYLPVLAAAGILLIAAAVFAHQFFMDSMSPINPARLAYMHDRAMAAAPAAGSANRNLATVGATDTGGFHGPHMVQLDDTPALSWHYLLGGRPVSVIFTTTRAVDTDQMQRIQVNERPYYLLQTPRGNVLVDTSEDLWRVVVGQSSALEMVVLLQSIPRCATFEQILQPLDAR